MKYKKSFATCVKSFETFVVKKFTSKEHKGMHKGTRRTLRIFLLLLQGFFIAQATVKSIYTEKNVAVFIPFKLIARLWNIITLYCRLLFVWFC
jgi:hypothetical protein